MVEYAEHKQAERVQRSLESVKNYRSGDIANAKLSLNLLLQKNQNQLIKFLGEQNSDVLKKRYADYILSLTDNTEVQRHLEIAFSFFEEIAVCIERDLCQHDVVISFFLNDARLLFNAYWPYICALRRQWKNTVLFTANCNGHKAKEMVLSVTSSKVFLLELIC
ncbi:MAG: hypothetical protein OEY36_03795 [Gammaproteobacteria bacterium]|nr:hypothetical protein [Gammaproteobacteria bacterium]